MKLLRLLHITFLALAVANIARAQTNTTSTKPKIGIMKFEVGEDVKPSLGTFLYESFSGEMLASGTFTVVDWEQLDKVQKVVAHAQPNVSPEEARKMALHQLGIEKLYLGTLTRVGSKFYLTVKLLNLELKVERSERLPAASEDGLEPTVVKLAKLLSASPQKAQQIKAQLERQKAETDSWAEVQKEPTEERVEAFLKEFPDGALAATANKALEELVNKRQASEVQWKMKRAEQRIAASEAEKLKQSIAGRWKLETTAATYQFGGATYTINGVPGPVICAIEQKGKVISFLSPADSKQRNYKGTYESGFLRAEAKLIYGKFRIAGTVSEDGKRIVGKWTRLTSSLSTSGSVVFTRMDSEAKP